MKSDVGLCSGCCTRGAGKPTATESSFEKRCAEIYLRISGKLSCSGSTTCLSSLIPIFYHTEGEVGSAGTPHSKGARPWRSIKEPTVGARLPRWFRKHGLFAEEIIKGGSVPA